MSTIGPGSEPDDGEELGDDDAPEHDNRASTSSYASLASSETEELRSRSSILIKKATADMSTEPKVSIAVG